MADRYVLDTNIMSAILRKEPGVIHHVSLALLANAEFLLCPVVFYEILRGLERRDAKKQRTYFLRFVETFTWDDFTKLDWQLAAQTHALALAQGESPSDADLLIGTFAARRDAVIITDNEKHFAPFVSLLNLPTQNWRR